MWAECEDGEDRIARARARRSSKGVRPQRDSEHSARIGLERTTGAAGKGEAEKTEGGA